MPWSSVPRNSPLDDVNLRFRIVISNQNRDLNSLISALSQRASNGETMASEEETLQDEQMSEEKDQTQEQEADFEELQAQTTEQETTRTNSASKQYPGRSHFVHGLSVGFGIGCIAMFVIVWLTIFLTPQLPYSLTYENLLPVFIYPLIFLLTVGLVSLTSGVVREYYVSH